jgi:hypothetical protein
MKEESSKLFLIVPNALDLNAEDGISVPILSQLARSHPRRPKSPG